MEVSTCHVMVNGLSGVVGFMYQIKILFVVFTKCIWILGTDSQSVSQPTDREGLRRILKDLSTLQEQRKTVLYKVPN